jgi:hypothetical protein
MSPLTTVASVSRCRCLSGDRLRSRRSARTICTMRVPRRRTGVARPLAGVVQGPRAAPGWTARMRETGCQSGTGIADLRRGQPAVARSGATYPQQGRRELGSAWLIQPVVVPNETFYGRGALSLPPAPAARHGGRVWRTPRAVAGLSPQQPVVSTVAVLEDRQIIGPRTCWTHV